MTTITIGWLLIAQAAAPMAQKSTGYPTCDRFIAMVSECLPKMPAGERADKQQELEAFRSALSFIPAAVAAQRCEENLRLEIQRDRYACYAAAAAKHGTRTPCSLVTGAELAQILGKTVSEGQGAGSSCTYSAAGRGPQPIVIDAHWTDGSEHLTAARGAVVMIEAQTRDSKQKAVAGRTVPGLGDDAFLTLAGLMPMLSVRKGDAAITITAQMAEDQLIAVARRVIERLHTP